MSDLAYVGPKVEISNHGVVYRKDKEDKYVYLGVALEILKDIDNDYDKKSAYSHHFKSIKLAEEELHKILSKYENELDQSIREECNRFEDKIAHEIAFVQNLKKLSNIDKEVWIKNIEIMREYRIKRERNKMYYTHCIEDIVTVIKDKKLKEISAPFNKDFFHVFNTIKGALITGKPSLDAKIVEEYNQEGNMIIILRIKS